MLDLARVVKAHNNGHAVDLEFMRDGRRVAGVQVMSGLAGTDFGVSGVVSPEKEGFDQLNNKVRDVFAVVGVVGDHPVVLGFLFPQISHMLFDEKGRWVFRHPSDAYATIDASANTEFAHPSGAFVRIGTSPAHEDLTGKDFDKVWAIRRNTGTAVHIHVEIPGKVRLNLAPSGQVDLWAEGNINVETAASLSVKAAQNIDMEAGSHISLKAPRIDFN